MTPIKSELIPQVVSTLKKTLAGSLIAAAFTVAQAQAGTITIDFEDPAFTDVGFFLAGDSVNLGQFNVLVDSPDGGMPGLPVNGSDPWACAGMGCPVNNSSNYFAGVNNAWMFLSYNSGSVRMQSLDFSFLAPYAGVINGVVGRLLVLALDNQGNIAGLTSKEFAPQVNGQWMFTDWSGIGADFGNKFYSNYAITACLYTTSNQCAVNANNQGQFAVDNINFDVPAPATLGLIGFSLLGLAASRRRTNANK